MNKTILLASFIFPERVDWFLSYLQNKFKINKELVFCYKNLDDESKMILTFKFKIKEGEKINFKDLFPSAIIIHKKGDALYTINALNKLIDSISTNDIGNVDYKSININWTEYQNKFILINNEELNIFNIKRVF